MKKTIFLNKGISKQEFLLGMAIIVFCITFWSLVEPPVTISTARVEVRRIDQEEKVESVTDKDGNVEVYVRDK